MGTPGGRPTPGAHDLLDNIHPDWELDCQANYVFYKVEDPAKKIRGLWFYEDSERTKIEAALNKVLVQIRSAREPYTEPLPMKTQQGQQQFGLNKPPEGGAQESIRVTPASIR